MTTTPARAGRAVELLARADELDHDARNFNLLTGERERAAARAGRAAVLAIGHALVAALPDETADALAIERDAARTELGRVDQKAGVALSAAGLLLSAAPTWPRSACSACGAPWRFSRPPAPCCCWSSGPHSPAPVPVRASWPTPRRTGPPP